MNEMVPQGAASREPYYIQAGDIVRDVVQYSHTVLPHQPDSRWKMEFHALICNRWNVIGLLTTLYSAWPAPTIGNRGNLRLGGVMLVSQVFLALRRAGRAGVNRWRFVRFVQRRARHTVDVGRYTMSFGGDQAALVSSQPQH
ncbi:hypothetical protein A9K55_004936 [Cordyceps militaris]|uniref:Uncharacterized protein n=1 Tax=Cordyceps militaris TaxID=73501 RepID=A0A2H4SLN9_CORMI|nr:hypothetical protein A9K55_004936 [Cordyceps militaris]